MPPKKNDFLRFKTQKTFQYQIILKGNDANSAYYPFSRLSSKKLINSSEILEISPLS